MAGIAYSKNSKPGKVLDLALKRCGLPRIRVHDLRHVFASYFVMGGGESSPCNGSWGHSTPQITSDTYGHLAPITWQAPGIACAFKAPRRCISRTAIPFQAPAKDKVRTKQARRRRRKAG